MASRTHIGASDVGKLVVGHQKLCVEDSSAARQVAESIDLSKVDGPHLCKIHGGEIASVVRRHTGRGSLLNDSNFDATVLRGVHEGLIYGHSQATTLPSRCSRAFRQSHVVAGNVDRSSRRIDCLEPCFVRRARKLVWYASIDDIREDGAHRTT